MLQWCLTYDSFAPEHEPLRETLTTLGNGYIATRGAFEGAIADDVHYPGTYLAGGYNRLESLIGDRTISNEDLVNWPNWLPITFKPEGSDWFNLQAVTVLSYKQTLNMKEGVLERTLRVKDAHGRESTVQSRRFVHMGSPHFAAIEYTITPHNWSGEMQLRSSLDGSVINAGVKRYQDLNSKHLHLIEMGSLDDERMFIHVETNQSHIRLAEVARHQIFMNDKRLFIKPRCLEEEKCITHEYAMRVESNCPVRVEKIVVVHSSRDRAVSECLYDATLKSQHAEPFDALLQTHRDAWSQLWHRCDVEIETDGEEQRILRLHIFHLLQTISLNSVSMDIGVPARGLHGEAYRGHIFWDELFIFPFYSYRLSEITRALLLYRYHRLDAARIVAREAGFEGAMFPWQSGSDGQEETQLMHLNPRSGAWGEDLSRYQRHVNTAIAYNIWQYVRMTDDEHFLSTYGAEMLLEIARFLASITTFDEKRERYEIKHVVGPDEYHEQYPDSEDAGINNNAYTNVMTVWVLGKALEVLSILQPDRAEELINQLNISEDETARWRDITYKMLVPFHDGNIISQFEGYASLLPFEWARYREKYGNIERLDRILKAEGDTPNKYQVSKQADAMMLFYLFNQEELESIFHQLGYTQFDVQSREDTITYYQARTSHGSTLSKVVFASELRFIDERAANKHFEAALVSDLLDTQGGTTPEGIHLGAMSGTVDLVMRHYAGVSVNHLGLHINPRLPSHVKGLCFRIQHQGYWYRLNITQDKVMVTLELSHSTQLETQTLHVYGKEVAVEAAIEQEFIKP